MTADFCRSKHILSIFERNNGVLPRHHSSSPTARDYRHPLSQRLIGAAAMIVETTANQLFRVRSAGAGLDHVWVGTQVKRSARGFVPKAKARDILVRKVGCRIVDPEAPSITDYLMSPEGRAATRLNVEILAGLLALNHAQRAFLLQSIKDNTWQKPEVQAAIRALGDAPAAQ
ncbi:hypothetical protein [Enterovirga sp. CN4-39]|uniref:hypothetical protein n=1 Tax=Enterovirga sp. CN4-39 TaxID=3400910 RepID=UPI003C1223F1